MTCPDCHGKGTGPSYKCPQCNAIIVEVGYCPGCWNAGYIADVCKRCGGSGQVPKESS